MSRDNQTRMAVCERCTSNIHAIGVENARDQLYRANEMHARFTMGRDDKVDGLLQEEKSEDEEFFVGLHVSSCLDRKY